MAPSLRQAQPLWTAEEAERATSGRSTKPWQAEGVSIDSRSVRSGDLFVALPGERVDGHDYVAAALAKGAAAALVERLPAGAEAAPLLLVPDALAGLTELGRHARRRSMARFVAVTGSVGKTSTKEMLRLALGAQRRTSASEGNLNNQIGTPLSLARLAVEAEIGVFELGMNHPGEIAPIARLTRPHIAIITNVEAVHLEAFVSEEAIADAKAEIFEGMEKGGIAILNRDNRHFDRLAAAAKVRGLTVKSFGESRGADFRLVQSLTQPGSVEVAADIAGTSIGYAMPVSGKHWAINSLAVLGAAHLLGLDLSRAASALGAIKAPKGRGERRTVRLAGGGSFELIDDSYNASPVAVRAALAVLGQIAPAPGARRVFILGDMRELGASGPALHAELAASVLANHIDRLHTVGPLSQHLRQALPPTIQGLHAGTSEEMARLVSADIRAGDVVTVKGSLGTNMAPIIKALAALDRPPGSERGA
ncbi:MAG: UDP-N-acetylmuramoyl-tripeptide--D-alanyl-D-alanine ligase [Proteobacteria bacterium]|nr:UDP-N-acetylmuramoyl-tripeptide--D-alanyl-D-alanine ligase [Pseudomonadota bacterium]MBI3496584.1 UDP-N-acetylmuramoyl-tripeptide--D-alanyl-D-alanine ligase [Pseudomonadota bacterium]